MTFEMMDNGELLMMDEDGQAVKLVGSRQYRRVYDQNLPVEDERPSVLAAKAHSKAKLLLMCERLGINTRSSSGKIFFFLIFFHKFLQNFNNSNLLTS